MNAHQGAITSSPMVLNVNATPSSSGQMSQCVNLGVIKESGRPHNGDVNLT